MNLAVLLYSLFLYVLETIMIYNEFNIFLNVRIKADSLNIFVQSKGLRDKNKLNKPLK